MKNINSNTIWAAVIGLVVGLILGWLIGHNMFGSKVVPVKSEDTTKNSAEVMPVEEGKPSTNALVINSSLSEESNSAVMVKDQVAGASVSVASVETDASTWVVVREDKNGVLGNILGATRIDAGNSAHVVVSLLRSTVVGQTYQVVLFKDDGDKKFDHKIDVPLTSDGVLIAQSFKALAQ
jgi:hypothetical protein